MNVRHIAIEGNELAYSKVLHFLGKIDNEYSIFRSFLSSCLDQAKALVLLWKYRSSKKSNALVGTRISRATNKVSLTYVDCTLALIDSSTED